MWFIFCGRSFFNTQKICCSARVVRYHSTPWNWIYIFIWIWSNYICFFWYDYKTNIIASKSKKKRRENDHWLKFEIWTLKIYIRIIKNYTDIDPTVNTWPHISCIYRYNRSRTNICKEHLKIPKRYSEAVVFENFLKD